MSIFMSRYLKSGMQMVIFLNIIGSTIKLLAPYNINAVFTGQVLISFGVFFAWITMTEIGHIILTQRQNQLFIAANF